MPPHRHLHPYFTLAAKTSPENGVLSTTKQKRAIDQIRDAVILLHHIPRQFAGQSVPPSVEIPFGKSGENGRQHRDILHVASRKKQRIMALASCLVQSITYFLPSDGAP